MMRILGVALLAMAAPAAAQTTPADMATGAEIRATVAKMGATMKGGFAYEPVVKDGKTVAALEYWKGAGKPAVHPDEAEYAIVLEGSGTLVSGGTMPNPKLSQPGLVEGSPIVGGTTRKLGPGDVILVPAGVPHWFGINGKLVLLGMKLPRHAN